MTKLREKVKGGGELGISQLTLPVACALRGDRAHCHMRSKGQVQKKGYPDRGIDSSVVVFTDFPVTIDRKDNCIFDFAR